MDWEFKKASGRNVRSLNFIITEIKNRMIGYCK
jgi:hypothetical protein